MEKQLNRYDDATVERLVRSEFALAEEDRVWQVLNAYGKEARYVDKNRVWLAALRLANGDLRELERQIAVAQVDFRDVVGAAESPSLMKLGFTGMERIGKAAVEKLAAEDLQCYHDWLRTQ